jgi:predicted membrane protein (TIGR00267 family)
MKKKDGRLQKAEMVSKKMDILAGENHRSNRLSDVILGGQDGLVNVLGVILGVAAASQDTRIVLAGGLAATFAESISMAAVAYTSKLAERDFYRSELEREKREIKEVPHMEIEEVREIYRRKGFKGDLLEQIVKVITSNEKIWLETMMRDELQLSPVEEKRPFIAAFVVGVSAVVGSFVPLWPFFFLPIQTGIWTSMGVSAIALFLVGVIKAKLTIGHWVRSGIEMAIIGMVSALAGYGIGLLFTPAA